MSDWSQDSADLFAAGRTLDEPSAEDRDRVALRIAARIAVAGGGAAVVSLATPLATPLVAAPAALAKGGAALSLAKVLLSLAVGVGAVTAATAAVVVIARSSAAPRPVEVQVPAAAKVPVPGVVTDRRTARMPVPPPEPVEPAVVAPVTLTAPLASPLPVIAPAPVHAAPAPVVSSTAMPAPMPGPAAASPSSAVASRPAEDTASEARLVRGIDEALRHHDVPTAQRLLDEHDATFPGGHFTEECAAARVLARCDALAGEDTSHAACTFFTQHPRSPMRARIEQACAPRCE